MRLDASHTRALIINMIISCKKGTTLTGQDNDHDFFFFYYYYYYYEYEYEEQRLRRVPKLL